MSGDIQEGSREGNAKFNFLGIIWENKRSSGFQRALNAKFDKHSASQFELLESWKICYQLTVATFRLIFVLCQGHYIKFHL